ncbi:YjjG family noncanonical pyrimidine nucleotidase [Flavobacterium sp. UMI-01]|uniref:YjjG family noncanonical pyrimidine nucleotidase n=1 Tax=Flavobacterium sp. UMI-01 TaxID=1441053 RepID=UPI001C7D5FE2|nr:YjjG family noncanonical pyrimidine nucleotidase [Flavobacterium sp. UMI-01]GIZ07369.1 noncanonical pyrimidine nucleotidase, YjjG family protein [Flavobacterium sp. UMI-01]
MKVNAIKDVFFDLDHTLWDFDKNSALAFEVILKERHPLVNRAAFIEAYIPINQSCWKLFQYNKITHEELRYNRLKYSFDALGYPVTDQEIDCISAQYIELLPENNHLFDGAVEILDYLKSKYRLHIITNGFAAVQYKKMHKAQLISYFTTITNSEMAGVKKPNPVIFEYALQLAKAKKESSIMIGDSLDADVQGALDSGLDAIYFNEAIATFPTNIKQITHLLQLKNYL